MSAIAPSPGLDEALSARFAQIERALAVAAARHGTPAYVADAVELGRAVDELSAAFPEPWQRRFSVKANDEPSVVRLLAERGLGANCVSRGEWAVARRAGIANREVTLEGIGKTAADLRAAVRAAADGRPLAWVSVESPEEADALAAIATRAGLGGRRADARPGLDVLLRLNPDVAPETTAGLAVGIGGSKFGMDETELTATIERLPPSLNARGVHVHVGSQLGAVDAWREAARRAVALAALLRGSRPGFDTVDLGGGFPVGAPGSVPAVSRFAGEARAILDATPADRRPTVLAIEPGRFLVARSGWLLARVLHARERGGPLVVLDAGMTELVRPALYGTIHPVVALRPDGRTGAGDLRPTIVEGPICESTDHLGVHLLPPLRRGDLVAIASVGAYGASMSSSYNGRPRARQLVLGLDGTVTQARRAG